MFGPKDPIGIGDTIVVQWRYGNRESTFKGILKWRDRHLWSIELVELQPGTILVINTMNANLTLIELIKSHNEF